MQRFFESSTVSTYIKYLLSCNPLPTYPTISTDEYMVAGVTYIYKNDILKCTQSGRFNGIRPSNYKTDFLVVSDDLILTDDDNVMQHLRYDPETETYKWMYIKDEKGVGGLTITDEMVRRSYIPIADYQIIGNFSLGTYYPNITRQFVSNVNYYDSRTHRELGNYLRCLRDIKGVDLMSLYNCFDYTIAENIRITKEGIINEVDPKSKIILIPIKFNKTYTIAVDCPFPVYVCPLFYDGRTLIKDSNNESMSDKVKYALTKFNSLQFIEPQTFMLTNDPSDIIDVDSTDEVIVNKAILEATKYCAMMSDYEKYLYLAIQLPASNTSSIVVLEGDYTSVAEAYVSSAQEIDKLGDPAISKIFRSRLSLLHSNDSTQKPFSDKLIEYLVRYTIDDREYIDENVASIEDAIGYDPGIKDFYPGMWDNGLRYALYKTYMQLPELEWVNKEDILGFVDLDIENGVNRNMMKIKTPAERGLAPYNG